MQSVAEAQFPSMPKSAARYVDIDRVLNVGQIPSALVRLAHEPVEERADISGNLNLEVDILGMDAEALKRAETLGVPAPFSCPDCGGAMLEYYAGDLLRFRCQVGRAFSNQSMFAHQADVLDRSLWAAYQKLDERIELSRRLARDATRFSDTTSEYRFTRQLAQLETQREQIRQALLKEDEDDLQSAQSAQR